ncbi:hypothetical protein BHYA_0089g00360 [Botrytis hyacinthi]|uniref:Uncharacterized protein n=1 Tax=Botrytis hyacinthi TaxID=278943 RepID=A0A4Z1GWN8_9HELO|nr:hypothetical protein BHYA_0089g00360 [Botrytis hyacinthi]
MALKNTNLASVSLRIAPRRPNFEATCIIRSGYFFVSITIPKPKIGKSRVFPLTIGLLLANAGTSQLNKKRRYAITEIIKVPRAVAVTTSRHRLIRMDMARSVGDVECHLAPHDGATEPREEKNVAVQS